MAFVTTFYAGLLALLYVALAIRVILRRRAAGVALGTGGRADLERATRVHANCAEYVPIAIALMLLVELTGSQTWPVHAAGVALLAGRALHAFGVSREPEDFRFRVTGMALTLTTILALGGLAVARGSTAIG